MEKCSACGAPMQNGTCPYCGTIGTQTTARTSQAQTGTQPQVVINNVATNTVAGAPTIDVPRKSKWVAFFLCLFFGYFGVHNFYAGKIGMGVLYLLTLGLFGIGWVVDIFRILLGAYRDKWGRNLEG